ncbi:MAG TPA: c-type cytochrome [Burkholderiaceae bacterium]|jgi:cytochrome c|nr:c-type cytochrome [Burkholderiaceae bacterium]
MNAARVLVSAVAILAAQQALPATAPPRPGANADAARLQHGEQVYARCAACHAVETNRTGPQHCGLFGRRAGTAPGYDTYSPAMRNSKIVWDGHSLDVFLQAPTQAVPGTAMGYAGVKDAQERADLIAWLRVATQPGKTCRIAR